MKPKLLGLKESLRMICIVEDDKPTAKALSRLLSTHGFQTSVFHTAKEFMHSQKQFVADCLLLDVNLPDIDGLELQEDLCSEIPDLPIVFLTGNGDVPMSVRAMRGGAIDFLLKPVQEAKLLRALERAQVLRRSNADKQNQHLEACKLINRLTPRELEIFRCVLTGAMNKQIAFHLGIAEKTVKVHRGQIIRKIGARTIVDLLEIAQQAGIDRDPDLKP